MNIVYILHSTDKLGGASKSFMTLLKGVRDKGVSPIVVLPDKNGIYNELVKMEVPVVTTIYRPNTYPYHKTVKDYFLFIPRLIARRYVNARAVARLTKIFSARHIDIIHTNVSVIDIGFRLSRKLRKPHIYHIREYGDLDFSEYYYPSSKVFHRTLHFPESYAICITRDLLKYHKLQESDSYKIVYNGICSRKNDIPVTLKEDYFLYAGRIEPAKGLLSLLEAYCLFCKKTQRNIPLWIAGEVCDEEYAEKVNLFVQSSRLSSSVCFLGARNDMERLMQNAKAIIIPSRFEAFGRCMAEAMFNGCLVVGKYTGGTKEQFENGIRMTGKEIGLRYDTAEELVECLEAASQSSEANEAMIQRAFYTVNRLYSKDEYIDQIYNFYNHIIDGKSIIVRTETY